MATPTTPIRQQKRVEDTSRQYNPRWIAFGAAIVIALILFLVAKDQPKPSTETATTPPTPSPAPAPSTPATVAAGPAQGGKASVVENVTLTDAELDRKIALSSSKESLAHSEAVYWQGVKKRRADALQAARNAAKKREQEEAAKRAQERDRLKKEIAAAAKAKADAAAQEAAKKEALEKLGD